MLIIDIISFFLIIIISFKKNINIGLIAITTLLISSILLNKPISTPSLNLSLIILSVIITTNTLAASGAINYLSEITEKALIKHKSFIEIIAPILTFILTYLCGTPYIVLAIIPIVIKISIEENIKPVYTVTGCIIAANHSYLCSPIGSPFIILTSILKLNKLYVLTTLTLSCLAGVLSAILYNFLRQKYTTNDINFNDYTNTYNKLDIKNNNNYTAKKAIFIFIIGLFMIFLFGLNDTLRPYTINNNVLKKSDMDILIPLFMFSITSAIIYCCKINIKDILEQITMEYGLKSIITITGISWFSNTIIENNKLILSTIINDTTSYIILGLILFIASVFMASQSAAILIFIPIYLSLGINKISILKITPFVDGLFFIPLTAIFSFAIECDKTKSTKSGNYIINHSMMVPGLISTFTSTLVMYYIVK